MAPLLRALRLFLPLLLLGAATNQASAQPRHWRVPDSHPLIGKLDEELNRRARVATTGRRSRVIVRVAAGGDLPLSLKPYQRGARINLIDSFVLDLPDHVLPDV